VRSLEGLDNRHNDVFLCHEIVTNWRGFVCHSLRASVFVLGRLAIGSLGTSGALMYVQTLIGSNVAKYVRTWMSLSSHNSDRRCMPSGNSVNSNKINAAFPVKSPMLHMAPLVFHFSAVRMKLAKDMALFSTSPIVDKPMLLLV